MGWSEDPSIRELTDSKPRCQRDAAPRLLDVTRLGELGWRTRIGLGEGVVDVYRSFLEHVADRVRAA